MITIERIGPPKIGECEYKLTQDGVELTTFIHNRSDDLKVCLIKASEAVDKGRWEQTLRLYDKGHAGG